jgi:hypothetical protein
VQNEEDVTSEVYGGLNATRITYPCITYIVAGNQRVDSRLLSLEIVLCTAYEMKAEKVLLILFCQVFMSISVCHSLRG